MTSEHLNGTGSILTRSQRPDDSLILCPSADRPHPHPNDLTRASSPPSPQGQSSSLRPKVGMGTVPAPSLTLGEHQADADHPRGPPTLALPQTPLAAAAPKQGEQTSSSNSSSQSLLASQSVTLRKCVWPNLGWQKIRLVMTWTMKWQDWKAGLLVATPGGLAETWSSAVKKTDHGNVLSVLSQQPGPPCNYGALEMWLLQLRN